MKTNKRPYWQGPKRDPLWSQRVWQIIWFRNTIEEIVSSYHQRGMRVNIGLTNNAMKEGK